MPKPPIDPALIHAIRNMKPRQVLYELIKQELQRRGRWKRAPRGSLTRREQTTDNRPHPRQDKP